MPTTKDLINLMQKYFPNATPKEWNSILWEKTGYPNFLEEGFKSLEEQVAKYARAVQLKREVCWGCGKIKHQSQLEFGMCQRCGNKVESNNGG